MQTIHISEMSLPLGIFFRVMQCWKPHSWISFFCLHPPQEYLYKVRVENNKKIILNSHAFNFRIKENQQKTELALNFLVSKNIHRYIIFTPTLIFTLFLCIYCNPSKILCTSTEFSGLRELICIPIYIVH